MLERLGKEYFQLYEAGGIFQAISQSSITMANSANG